MKNNAIPISCCFNFHFRGTKLVTSAGALGTRHPRRAAGAFAFAAHRLGGIGEHLWPMFGHEALGRSDLVRDGLGADIADMTVI